MEKLEELMELLESLWATVLSGILLVISLTLWYFEVPTPVDPAWGAIVISGLPLAWEAFSALFAEHRITSALLVTCAMIASMAIGETFAAGEIAFIMALGEILEDRTVAKAKRGIAQLVSLAPEEAHRLRDGAVETIPAAEVALGDILRIFPGERIPVDGLVVEGAASIDQSIMTGEPLPVDKAVGDSVSSGTLSVVGSIDIQATHVGNETTLQRLIALVQADETQKAPTQRLVDRWASALVPIALLIALITFGVCFFCGVELQDALTRGITVLVVFCPCALALATPTAMMAAIGKGAKHGILIKSGESLEAMGAIEFLAFDKTGTLTTGQPALVDLLPLQGSEADLLRLAASAEQRSEHPLAKAIVRAAQARSLSLTDAPDFHMTIGKGIEATVEGRPLRCGNEAWIAQDLPETLRQRIAEARNQGQVVLLVAHGEVLLGALFLADALKPTAQAAIAQLREQSVKTLLLTGDHLTTAQVLAKNLGINDVRANLLPQEKSAILGELVAAGHPVAMVGDGVNDAIALKTATVGISMGGVGSDVAIEAADIVLMHDDLTSIPLLRRLAKATLATIRNGITASMTINLIAVLLSVLGWLTPVWGALVHNAGSFLVIAYAANLARRKL